MIRCFGKSRAMFVLGVVCTVALAVPAGLQRADAPLWVLCITVGLVLVLGTGLSKLLAGMIASHCNQRLLAILHLQLRPKEFLEAYTRVPERTAPKSTARVITSAYLADGYCAAGKPQKALETLVWSFDVDKRGSRLPLQGLLLHNRCRYLLYCGDVSGACGAANSLQEVIEQLEKENPALALNLGGQLELYRVWVGVLNGISADEEYLEEKLEQITTKIARLELYWVLALHCKNIMQNEKTIKYLRQIIDEGGGVALVEAAEKMLAQG